MFCYVEKCAPTVIVNVDYITILNHGGVTNLIRLGIIKKEKGVVFVFLFIR